MNAANDNRLKLTLPTHHLVRFIQRVRLLDGTVQESEWTELVPHEVLFPPNKTRDS